MPPSQPNDRGGTILEPAVTPDPGYPLPKNAHGPTSRGAGEIVSTPTADRPTPSTSPIRSQRRVLMTTCQTHGAAGFTNLLVTKEGGYIVLNPHLGNCCILRLDEHIATALYRLLGEWLGYEPLAD